jgi:hypothetical protein
MARTFMAWRRGRSTSIDKLTRGFCSTLLDEKPVHVVKVSEKGTSSKDPFTGKIIKKFEPLVIRSAVKGLKRVEVVKIVLRVAKVSGRALERDIVGAINIGLKYLNSDGSPVALGSTGTHEVRVKHSQIPSSTVSGETRLLETRRGVSEL